MDHWRVLSILIYIVSQIQVLTSTQNKTKTKKSPPLAQAPARTTVYRRFSLWRPAIFPPALSSCSKMTPHTPSSQPKHSPRNIYPLETAPAYLIGSAVSGLVSRPSSVICPPVSWLLSPGPAKYPLFLSLRLALGPKLGTHALLCKEAAAATPMLTQISKNSVISCR